MTGLRQCTSVAQHQYPSHLNRCPYCSQQIRTHTAPTAPSPTVSTPVKSPPVAAGTRAVQRSHAPSPTSQSAARTPKKTPALAIALVAIVATGAAGLGLVSAADRPAAQTEQPASTPSPSVDSADTAPDGAWVTVLASLDQDKTALAKARSRATRLSTSKVRVYVLDSTNTPGLNPGYWALVLMPFPTRAKAAAACATVDRSVGGTCYPRLIG